MARLRIHGKQKTMTTACASKSRTLTKFSIVISLCVSARLLPCADLLNGILLRPRFNPISQLLTWGGG
ncbi:hypothetical protein NL676_005479 [Syzygium grande]|nr:hypothetical protein NL676_005476 [Syzygium grande]KAI6670594.1 hypothetical protein NL676_005479 [Syzygium grande]